MKKILVIGGTMFIGRAFVELLKTKPGYDITLFNRGKSNSGLFAGLKQIHGNRETGDIDKITDNNWDCVVDFCGYYPTTFGQLLDSLQGRVGRYIFISTLSVYNLAASGSKPITESDITLPCTDEQKISKLPDAYGEKKAEMERMLLQRQWLDKIIFRPSFIYGVNDWTERFYYWLYRAKFAGKILMPDGGKPYSFSLTNAADLALALVQAIEINKHRTVYNTVSQTNTNLRHVVQTAAGSLGTSPEFISTENTRLKQLGLTNADFPLYVPFNWSADDTRWKEDFPFERGSMAQAFTEMLQQKAEAGYPVPPVGLNPQKESSIIAAL
jgi:2'-hydroxyisoflavone reductase